MKTRFPQVSSSTFRFLQPIFFFSQQHKKSADFNQHKYGVISQIGEGVFSNIKRYAKGSD